jgi:hypothetical protein
MIQAARDRPRPPRPARRALAAADPPAAGQARLPARQGLAAAPGLGAVAVKNAVHALPATAEAQEDLAWLLREIEQGGGEAIVCEARLVEGLTDQEVRALFDRARDEDYQELAKDVRAVAAALGGDPPPERRAEARRSSRA